MRTFIYCAFIGILLTGCSQPTPPGLPPLASCTVRVMDKDKPLPEIDVSFLRSEGQGAWTINGKTNSSGIAVAKTVIGSYKKNAIPIGTYRITLGERIDLPPEFVDDPPREPRKRKDFDERRKNYLAERRTLPEILCNSSTTPLELVVEKSGAELSIDVSIYRDAKSK
ncbi:MAG: Ig-like domain-containing protein [Planctomycetaceae bacterium]|jgi:hypothetical protein|nr:Ig-like domain-containing protein [Planctomycetaceae bacterium]